MDISQTNDNELQQAIEDITGGNAGVNEIPSNEAVAELEAKIQGEMGAPAAPVVPEITPPTSAEGVPMPEVAAPVESAPAEVTPEVAPAASEAVPVAPEVASAPSGDLESVKEAMLMDLFPLMDKVEMTPERKYELYKQMLDKNQDKGLIPAAYEAVKGIGDEAAKAAALLYLVELAEK